LCNPLIPTHLLKSIVSASGLKEVLKLALKAEHLNLNYLEPIIHLLENSALPFKESNFKIYLCTVHTVRCGMYNYLFKRIISMGIKLWYRFHFFN